jgi:hypothetical protein
MPGYLSPNHCAPATMLPEPSSFHSRGVSSICVSNSKLSFYQPWQNPRMLSRFNGFDHFPMTPLTTQTTASKPPPEPPLRESPELPLPLPRENNVLYLGAALCFSSILGAFTSVTPLYSLLGPSAWVISSAIASS